MILVADGFDRDDGNRTKCPKHGVSTCHSRPEAFADRRSADHHRRTDWKVSICRVYAANWPSPATHSSSLGSLQARADKLLMRKAKKRVPRLKPDKAAE